MSASGPSGPLVFPLSISLSMFFGTQKNRLLSLRWVCLFDLILYIPVNNLPVMLGRVFLGRTSTKLGLMCLAQGHNAVRLVRLKPTALRSGVKHFTTDPLGSLH